MTDERIGARLRRLPQIRRARGYRLYTAGGSRLLDLYQDGGRAILGHRGGTVLREVANVLDRGTASAFPSSEEHRLSRAVAALLVAVGANAARVRVYRTFDGALAAVRLATGAPPGSTPIDPALPPSGSNTAEPDATTSLWRPFLPPDAAARCAASAVLLPVLPLPSAFALHVAVGRTVDLPPSDLLPEAVLRGATVAAWALVAAAGRPAAELHGFLSVGPYLAPDLALRAWDDYDRVYDGFLNRGIVLNPDPAGPSIMPGEYSEGEAKRLWHSAREVLSPERPGGEEGPHE